MYVHNSAPVIISCLFTFGRHFLKGQASNAQKLNKSSTIQKKLKFSEVFQLHCGFQRTLVNIVSIELFFSFSEHCVPCAPMYFKIKCLYFERLRSIQQQILNLQSLLSKKWIDTLCPVLQLNLSKMPPENFILSNMRLAS